MEGKQKRAADRTEIIQFLIKNEMIQSRKMVTARRT